jgi:hypothetical protein
MSVSANLPTGSSLLQLTALPKAAPKLLVTVIYSSLAMLPTSQTRHINRRHVIRVVVLQLQLIAMTRGIYISQKTSRKLGVMPGADHPDLLFDARHQPANGMSGKQPLQ